MATANQNKMPSLTSFTKFPELPPEIQLQIWESTIASQPAMHLFDVCIPPNVSEPAQTAITSPTSDGQNDGDESNANTDTRLSKGGEALYLDEVTDTLYLSPLATTTTHNLISQENTTQTQGACFRVDPSMYNFRRSLAATCIDAAATMRRSTTARGPRHSCGSSSSSSSSSSSNSSGDMNTIYLGAPSTERGCASVTYDNTQDVLHLRFVPPAFRFPDGGRLASPISAMFESIWSQELEGALYRARRVAIDVSQLWPDLAARLTGEGDGEQEEEDGVGEDVAMEDVTLEAEVLNGEEEEEEEAESEADNEDDEPGSIDERDLIMQDIAFLACTIEHDLEALYLVDYCAGRCDAGSSRSSSLKARDLMGRRDDGLYRALGNEETWEIEKERRPDVIQGVGKVWREVFDLEKLGWHEEHPGFLFAKLFTVAIKMQQEMDDGNQDGGTSNESMKFKGVRVLVAEDEEIDGEDGSMLLHCDSHQNGL